MNSQKKVRIIIFLLMIILLILNPLDNIFSEQTAVSMESISTTNNGMEGEGTEHNPYIIRSVTQLRSITLEGNHDKHYRLGNDLDLLEFDAGDDIGWLPLGGVEIGISSFGDNTNSVTEAETIFSGTLDGAGHTLHNLYINNSHFLSSVGLFSELDGATIKNIHFENVNISANAEKTAVLAGSVNESTIENITIEGEVDGYANVAGVAVDIYNSTIENVEVDASILVHSMYGLAAGIAIYSGDSTFHDIAFEGEVYSAGEGAAGGIGFADSSTISKVKINADISSEYGDVAGVASFLQFSSIGDAEIYGNIESESGNAAGVVAQLESSSVRNAQIFANITSLEARAGGVAAYSTRSWNPEMENSYIADIFSNSHIQGGMATGGIVGMTYETYVENVHASGSVKNGQYVGGIVGSAENTSIRYALSTVVLEADEHNTSHIGGILGYPTDDNDDISHSYWLRTMSLEELEDYSNLSLSRTDVELKQRENYLGWDFNSKWRIYESEAYPFLIQFNPIREITVSDNVIHLFEGEEYPIEVTVHYEKVGSFNVTDMSSYETSNSIISINSSGVIATLEREGNSVVTVSYGGVQEQISVEVTAIPVAKEVHFVDTDLRQNKYRGRISWLPADNEKYISAYEVHLLDNNLLSILKIDEVKQGSDYFIDIPAGTTFPDGATLIAVFAKSDESLFDKFTSILLEDTTWTNSFMYKHLLKNNLQQLESPFISPGAPISLSHLMIYLKEQPDVTGDGQYQQEDVQFLLELIEPSFIEVLTY